MHSSAATATADPPEEPPGMRVVSQGLRVVKKPEFSVELPMANSSMLVLPRIGRAAVRRRLTKVASYGGTQPSRILLPQVVGSPRVAMTSLTAIGTPASRCRLSPAMRRWSTSAAVRRAPSASTCRYE